MNRLFAGLAISAAAAASMAGCENRSVVSQNPPTVHVEASNTSIAAGETVTLTARTRDTYGRDAKVKWTATSGSVKTEQDGRVARVKFDEPGTYSVKAALLINGSEVQTDLVEVRVRPIG